MRQKGLDLKCETNQASGHSVATNIIVSELFMSLNEGITNNTNNKKTQTETRRFLLFVALSSSYIDDNNQNELFQIVLKVVGVNIGSCSCQLYLVKVFCFSI